MPRWITLVALAVAAALYAIALGWLDVGLAREQYPRLPWVIFALALVYIAVEGALVARGRRRDRERVLYERHDRD